MASPARPRRLWLFGALLVLSGFAVPYACAGWVMAGSMSTASLGRDPHWRQVALAYLALMALAGLGLVVALVVLYRHATRRETAAPADARRAASAPDAAGPG